MSLTLTQHSRAPEAQTTGDTTPVQQIVYVESPRSEVRVVCEVAARKLLYKPCCRSGLFDRSSSVRKVGTDVTPPLCDSAAAEICPPGPRLHPTEPAARLATHPWLRTLWISSFR